MDAARQPEWPSHFMSLFSRQTECKILQHFFALRLLALHALVLTLSLRRGCLSSCLFEKMGR